MRERASGRRVDVQDQIGRPVRVPGQEQVGVVLDRALVGEPHQRAPVVAERVPDLPLGRHGPHGHGADPRRRVVRHVLLHERRLPAAHPDHRQRPVGQPRHDKRGHRVQVVDQVALGRARPVEQRLVEVGQRDPVPFRRAHKHQRYGETLEAKNPEGTMAFSGWPEEALDFYDGLAVDNTKTYWTEHKAVYQDKILRPMTELTEELAAEFGEPKIFRPYRDVRFSADKTPYKTHIGATVGDTGYIQLSAEGLGAGAGMWQMGPDHLARYRAAVAEDGPGHKLEEIIAAIERAEVTVHGHGALKSAPRGYPVDHPRIDLLRFKGLTAWRQWPVEPWLETSSAKDRVISFFRTTLPLCSWLTDHVGR